MHTRTGALCGLWLAVKLMRAGAMSNHVKAKPASFVDGVILLVLNPKGYLIMFLMFSQI